MSLKKLRYVTDHVDTFEDYDHNDHVDNWKVQVNINEEKGKGNPEVLSLNDQLREIVNKMRYVKKDDYYSHRDHNYFVDAWKVQLEINKLIWGDISRARELISNLESIVNQMKYVCAGDWYYATLHNLFKDAWDIQIQLDELVYEKFASSMSTSLIEVAKVVNLSRFEGMLSVSMEDLVRFIMEYYLIAEDSVSVLLDAIISGMAKVSVTDTVSPSLTGKLTHKLVITGTLNVVPVDTCEIVRVVQVLAEDSVGVLLDAIASGMAHVKATDEVTPVLSAELTHKAIFTSTLSVSLAEVASVLRETFVSASDEVAPTLSASLKHSTPFTASVDASVSETVSVSVETYFSASVDVSVSEVASVLRETFVSTEDSVGVLLDAIASGTAKVTVTDTVSISLTSEFAHKAIFTSNVNVDLVDTCEIVRVAHVKATDEVTPVLSASLKHSTPFTASVSVSLVEAISVSAVTYFSASVDVSVSESVSVSAVTPFSASVSVSLSDSGSARRLPRTWSISASDSVSVSISGTFSTRTPQTHEITISESVSVSISGTFSTQ